MQLPIQTTSIVILLTHDNMYLPLLSIDNSLLWPFLYSANTNVRVYAFHSQEIQHNYKLSYTGCISEAYVKENQLLSIDQVICNLSKHINLINIFTLF